MYVRASDFRRTEAISQRTPKTSVSASAAENNGARVDRYARIANIILTGLRYSFAFFFFFKQKSRWRIAREKPARRLVSKTLISSLIYSHVIIKKV